MIARPVGLVVGVIFVTAGLVVNEWTVKWLLETDALGPVSRLITWAFSLGSVLWGVLTIRYGEHPGLPSVGLVAISVAGSIVAVELLLHAYPAVLGHSFANGVLTKYTAKPGGIYYFDRNLKMHFMIANFTTTMYYNGYVWEHRTDALGFRNPSVKIPSDMILLGDSFVYGHGLNLESTVGYFLERCAGGSVMNLARQGDSSFQQAYLVTEYIGLLRPRLVVYFFFENDVQDVHHYLSPAELAAFVATPVEEIRYAPRVKGDEALLKRPEEQARSGSLFDWMRRSSYIARVWDWLRFRREAAARVDEAYNLDPESLEWRYTKKAILYMRHVAERHGARFLMAPITPSTGRHYEILQDFAREHGIESVDTAEITVASDPSLFLVEDGRPGHFSEKGARRTALVVCEHVKGRYDGWGRGG